MKLKNISIREDYLTIFVTFFLFVIAAWSFGFTRGEQKAADTIFSTTKSTGVVNWSMLEHPLCPIDSGSLEESGLYDTGIEGAPGTGTVTPTVAQQIDNEQSMPTPDYGSHRLGHYAACVNDDNTFPATRVTGKVVYEEGNFVVVLDGESVVEHKENCQEYQTANELYSGEVYHYDNVTNGWYIEGKFPYDF